jgi:hypothetical protein
MKKPAELICSILAMLVIIPSSALAAGEEAGAGPRAETREYFMEAVCNLTGARYCSVNAIAIGDSDNDATDEVIANYDWYIEDGGNPATVILSWNGTAYEVEDTIEGFSMMYAPGTACQGLFHIVVGDADNDGLNELLMPGLQGGIAGVYMFKHGGSGYSMVWSAKNSAYEDAEIYDIDGDGSNEVFVTGMGVLRWEGGVMRMIDGLPRSEGIRIGDTDGEGRVEVVLATGPLGISVLGWDGRRLVPEGAASADGYIACGFGIGDSDADGMEECWRAEYHNGLVVWGWNGSDYAAEWQNKAPEGDNAVTAWSGDSDGDGLAEHFIGNGNHAGGSSVLQYELRDGIYLKTWDSGPLDLYCHCIALGDSDGDGYIEVLAGTGSTGRFYAFEARPRGTPGLNVYVAPERDAVDHGASVAVGITVRSNGSVDGAAISLVSSLGGAFGPVEEFGNGTYRTIYTATPDKPGNITRLTATASKDGYRRASGSATIRIVDTVPPAVAIIFPADGSIVAQGPIEVTGTAHDNVGVSRVELRIGDGPWWTCSGISEWNGRLELEEGVNLIWARASDDAGNRNQTSVKVTFDPEAPRIEISSPSEGSVVTGAVINVSGTASDNIGLGRVEICIGGSGWLECAKTSEWTGVLELSAGLNTILARATDLAGNFRTATLNLTADIAPPEIRVLAPAPGAVLLSSPVEVTGEAVDDTGISSVELAGNDGRWSPCTGTKAWSGSLNVTPGNNRAIARATDRAGRTATAAVEFIADLAPPSLSVASPADGAFWASWSVTVRGTAADDAGVARVEVGSDRLGWVVCNGSASWEGALILVEGPNRVLARATDLGGRTAEISFNLTIDTVPPALVVNRPADGWTSSTFDVAVTGTASDATGVARVELSADGLAWSSCTGTTRWSGTVRLAAGPGLIRVRATDRCGNAAERSLSITVDPTLPVVVIVRPADGTLLASPRVAVAGTASDDRGLAKVELSIDGRNWTPCRGTENWCGTIGLREGNNTIFARATDTDGKVQTTHVEVRLQTEDATVEGFPACWPAGLAAAVAISVVLLIWLRRRRDGLRPPDPPGG